MFDRGEALFEGDVDVELLADFADQTGFFGFAGLYLAAGEFPGERQGHACAALHG